MLGDCFCDFRFYQFQVCTIFMVKAWRSDLFHSCANLWVLTCNPWTGPGGGKPSKHKCTDIERVCPLYSWEEHHMPHQAGPQQGSWPSRWAIRSGSLICEKCHHLGQSFIFSVPRCQPCRCWRSRWCKVCSLCCGWWCLVCPMMHRY